MEAISIREYIIQKYEAQFERRFKRKIKAVENQAKVAENKVIEELKSISTAILQLHAKGYTPQAIADLFSKPLSFVLDVLEKNLTTKDNA